MTAILNLSGVDQYFGNSKVPADGWGDVPYATARTCAILPDYRCDSNELLRDFRFLAEDGTYLGWSSPLHYADGYGSIGQEIAKTFLQMGVGLHIALRDYHPGDPRCGNLQVKDWTEKAFVPEIVCDNVFKGEPECLYGINMTWPADIHKSCWPRSIGYTMFETTSPPRHWAKSMNQCRRIMVPCKQNKAAFESIGVTAPMHVVPLGVDPLCWPVIDRSKRNQPFTYLMSGGLTHRKNPAGAAKAFLDAFPNEPDVRLILKTRGEMTSPGFRAWRGAIPQDPRIQIVCEESTPAQMVGWMHAADAFVFPSRGEGFGLTPLQAMSTGLPVIVSDNSGMSEYADSRYCFPVWCEEVKVPDNRNGGFPDEWGDCGNWWEPSHNSLVNRLREVFINQTAAQYIGKAAAEWVRKEWTVQKTCMAILDVVMDDARESGLI